MPRLSALAGCCGAMVLTGLDGATDYSIREALRRYGNGTAFIATTTAGQRAGDALRANGFKAVGAFRNGNTGNRVTIWTRAAGQLRPIPGRTPATPAPRRRAPARRRTTTKTTD